MKRQKNILMICFAIMVLIYKAILPISAAELFSYYVVEPRAVNVTSFNLNATCDENGTVTIVVSVIPKTSCRGFDGALRLEDASGNFVKSWSVSDFSEPYSIQETWLCESGKTYIVSFQGYAYSNNGGMYDDLVASKTFTCP